MKKTLILALFLIMSQSSWAFDSIPQPPLFRGEKWTAHDQDNAEQILELMRDKLLRDTGNNPVMKRDAHPKQHGCVSAKLTIDTTYLQNHHMVGLFAKSATYPAIIRFSNGSPNHEQADIKGDVRGMAVKILGVPYDNYLSQNELESTAGVHDIKIQRKMISKTR